MTSQKTARFVQSLVLLFVFDVVSVFSFLDITVHIDVFSMPQLLKLLSVNNRAKILLKEAARLTMALFGLIRTSTPAETPLLCRKPSKPKVGCKGLATSK